MDDTTTMHQHVPATNPELVMTINISFKPLEAHVLLRRVSPPTSASHLAHSHRRSCSHQKARSFHCLNRRRLASPLLASSFLRAVPACFASLLHRCTVVCRLLWPTPAQSLSRKRRVTILGDSATHARRRRMVASGQLLGPFPGVQVPAHDAHPPSALSSGGSTLCSLQRRAPVGSLRSRSLGQALAHLTVASGATTAVARRLLPRRDGRFVLSEKGASNRCERPANRAVSD